MSLEFQEVPFGPLQGNSADERVPFEHALEISGCILDNDQLEVRPGYRAVTADQLGSSGDSEQELYRFRPSRTSARTVAVVGGGINLLTDPTTATASDSTIVGLGAPFSGTAIVSAAALNSNCYLATDEANVAWRRILSTYALQALSSIAQGAKPTLSAFSALSFTLFKNIMSDTPTVSGCVKQTSASTGMGSLNADWRVFTLTNNGNDNPAQGATALYKLDTAVDARTADWVAIVISPYDSNNPTGQVDVSVGFDTAGTATSMTLIGSTYDVPPIAGSPNLLYCNLTNLPAAVRSAIRWMQFTVSGTGGGKFGIYGFCFLPSMPPINPQSYYVDFYDSTNDVASPLTDPYVVSITPTNVGDFPTYPNSYIASHNFRTDTGAAGTLFYGNFRIFNQQAGKVMPSPTDIGAIVTFTGTSPSGYSGTLVPRLWKDTSDGRRLVSTTTAVSAGGSYTLTDNGGLGTLTNTLFKAGGAPPRAAALGASAGRLIAGFENRVYVSSYTPTSDTANPVPAFPNIPLIAADGWSFDFINKAEVITCIIGEDRGADATYIITQQNTRYIKELDAPLFGTPPIFLIINRGALGPHAAGYWEQKLFVAAKDGIYVASGRNYEGELTEPIRNIWINDFAPDCHVCLGYNVDERALYVCQDDQMMRCSFLHETPEWSGPHVLADSVRVLCGWVDP